MNIFSPVTFFSRTNRLGDRWIASEVAITSFVIVLIVCIFLENEAKGHFF